MKVGGSINIKWPIPEGLYIHQLKNRGSEHDLDLLADIEKIKNRDGKSILLPANEKNILAIKE